MSEVTGTTSLDQFEGFSVIEDSQAQKKEMRKTSVLCGYLRENSQTHGLFRLSGDQKKVEMLNQQDADGLEQTFSPSWIWSLISSPTIITVHDVVGALKMQVKNYPIFTPEQLEYLDRLMDIEKRITPNTTEAEKKEIEKAAAKCAIDYITAELSPANMSRLVNILQVIKEVSDQCKVNDMPLSNISIAFGPNLLLPTDSVSVVKGARVRSGKEPYMLPSAAEAAQIPRIARERVIKNDRLMSALVNHFG